MRKGDKKRHDAHFTPRPRKISRPANSFILYRQLMYSVLRKITFKRADEKKISSMTASSIIGLLWHHETKDVRACFETLAALERQHKDTEYCNIRIRLHKEMLLALLCSRADSTNHFLSVVDAEWISFTPSLVQSFDAFNKLYHV